MLLSEIVDLYKKYGDMDVMTWAEDGIGRSYQKELELDLIDEDKGIIVLSEV